MINETVHLCAETLDSGIRPIRCSTYKSACGEIIHGVQWFFPENTTCEECKKTEMWKGLVAEKIAKRLLPEKEPPTTYYKGRTWSTGPE